MGKFTSPGTASSPISTSLRLKARYQWQAGTSCPSSAVAICVEYYPIFSHDHYGAVRFDPTTKDILVMAKAAFPGHRSQRQ